MVSIVVAYRSINGGKKHVAYMDDCADYQEAMSVTRLAMPGELVVLALVQAVETVDMTMQWLGEMPPIG